jgi:peptidoglycan-N-acetylglucosamine deacetylase
MDMSVMWPGGARCAVMISFDFDAESNWIASDPNNSKRLGTLSQVTYGANVGVPKITITRSRHRSVAGRRLP